MMQLFFRRYFFLIFFIFSAACKKKEVHIPDTVLKKDVMVNVLADIHIAESALIVKNTFGANNESLAASYYKFIFQKYKITPEQFKTSYDFYTSHPEIFSELYKEVMNELSQHQAETLKK